MDARKKIPAHVRELPAEEQDRVAEAVRLFLRQWQDDGCHAA